MLWPRKVCRQACARAEEHLTVEESDDTRHTGRAEVAVIESWKKGISPTWSPGSEKASPVTLAEPKLVARETGVERWVEITTAHGRLVTVIGVLSPANKAGAGRIRYLSKRATYEEEGVNVVEIDLLRGGSPTVAATAGVPAEGATRYTICAFRAAKSERFEVYHWGLRDRIPAFAVPLCPEDPDAPLDLQPLIDRAYELGYYWQDTPSPTRIGPPLEGDEAAFATGQLLETGLIEPTLG